MPAFETLEIKHLPDGAYEVRLDTARYILADETQLREFLADETQLREFLARIDNRGEPVLDEENLL